MKQVMFALGISLLFLTSCKKENPEIDLPSPHPDPAYIFPSKAGSYWVYNCYIIDSTGTETSLNITDSVFITGDTLINGNVFTKYKGQYFGGNYSTYSQRDSSGYIIDPNGHVSFKYVDFNVKIDSSVIGSFPYNTYTQVLKDQVTITVPAGTFQAFVREHYLYSVDGNPVNQCGQPNLTFNSYVVSGIGQIYHETLGFNSEFYECKKRMRRLQSYYIPE